MKNLIWIFCFISFASMAQTKTSTKAKSKAKKEVAQEPVKLPDSKVSYVGGSEAMDKFIIANLKTPEKLKTDTTIKTSTVFLTFLIDKTGKITEVKVMKGIKHCKECGDEAMRVVKAMPNWNPAIENNEPKESWFNLPINFKRDKP